MADKDEIEFFNRTENVTICVIPRSEFTWLPGIGQRVSLQFENEESIYQIVDVTFRFKHRGTIGHRYGLVEYLKQRAGRAPGPGDLEEKTEAIGIRIDVEPT
jgi:hypothetical protein